MYRPKTAGGQAQASAEAPESEQPGSSRNRQAGESEPGEEKRRRRNRTQKRKAGGEENAVEANAPKNAAQEKRLALEKKREKMKTQYEPFKSSRTFRSRYQEYVVGEWRRQRNNLFVTMETIVPPVPKTLREEPDDSKYHLEVARMDAQIEELDGELQDLKAELHEKRTSLMDSQQGRAPIRESLRDLFSELNHYSGEKKEKLAQIERINNEINDLQRAVTKEQKNVHPVYNEEAKIAKGVKDLERRLQTQSHSRAEEERLIKEIEKVKESKPFFAKIAALRAQVAEKREE